MRARKKDLFGRQERTMEEASKGERMPHQVRQVLAWEEIFLARMTGGCL
jgi:hypothetical protein